MAEFSRTILGMIAKHKFYTYPILWVEGKGDFPFYERILRDKGCRIESANGKLNCEKLAESIKENGYPYVVVVDSDYSILERKRSMHRRVVLLHRYSIENYFFEKELLERVCCNLSRVVVSEDLISSTFDKNISLIDDGFKEVVIIDFAHFRAKTGKKVLPDNANRFLISDGELGIRTDQIKLVSDRFSKAVEKRELAKASALVNQFLKNNRLVNILKGHFAFSLLRRWVINVVKGRTGGRPNIDNNSLFVLFSSEVWLIPESKDHRSLKRRLLRAVSEARRLLNENNTSSLYPTS